MKARVRRGSGRRQRGLSYVEVMIAVVLLAAALAPALQAVTSGLAGARVHRGLAGGMTPVFGKMEELLARPTQCCSVPPSAAEAPAAARRRRSPPTTRRRRSSSPLPATVPPGPGYSDPGFNVYIHSVDPTTGAVANSDTGLLQVRVTAVSDGETLTSYKARSEDFE